MMHFNRDIKSQLLTINGVSYDCNHLEKISADYQGCDAEYLNEIVAFAKEWYNERATLLVHSSGSTGGPKPMMVEKERMMNSACSTCEFLQLQPGSTALLCLPLKYIAGKMMMVRALVANLNLIPVAPSGRPLRTLQTAPNFAALIPMQVFQSLAHEHDSAILAGITHVIIGGGAVDDELAKGIADFQNNLWSTYGMTETLSHIALRRLNGKEQSDWYTPMNNIEVSLSPEQTLCINAPQLCPEIQITNDIAEIAADGTFKIIGRKDNVINSGGIKIQIEEIERRLKPAIDQPFAITSVPDARLGEKMVMLIEGLVETAPIEAICRGILSDYKCPKLIINVEQIPLTETGKPNRASAKELAKKFASNNS